MADTAAGDSAEPEAPDAPPPSRSPNIADGPAADFSSARDANEGPGFANEPETDPAEASSPSRAATDSTSAFSCEVSSTIHNPVTRAICDAALPLAANSALHEAESLAKAGPNAFKLADFTIWPTEATPVTAADFAYDETAKTITVNTDVPFAIQNTDQATIAEGADAGRIANPSAVCLVIPSGRKAHLTMEGVGIRGRQPIDIKPGAELAIVLGDGTKNELAATDGLKAAIHCPTGASLVVDDTVLNRTAAGAPIVPKDGVIPTDCTLANGQRVSKGDPLSKLDSANPGELYAWTVSGSNAAAIGSDYNAAGWSISHACEGEAGGNMTFEGGHIVAVSGSNMDSSYSNGGAGIGAGCDGNGTGPNEWITINGGRVKTQGGGHGAGIGAGLYAASGNIRINGGFVEAFGGVHSSGFGGACNPQDSSAFQIILTGGTLLPTGGYVPGVDWVADAGAPNVNVIVTGGSLGNSSGADGFRFVGTAENDKGESIAMIEIDLTSDVGTNAYPIVAWQLLVDGVPYDYGAPAEFDKGHLYLWLPEEVKKNSEVTVQFTYLDTDNLDKNGNPTPVSPLPLFRPPGESDDGKLRRYVDFVLPSDYLNQLDKYYDGKDFPVFPLPFPTPDGRDLTEEDAITYRYQRLDGNGNPVKGNPLDGANVGTMKFTAISTQYSNDTDGNFSESYWGHRATGTCVIRPIASKVSDLRAEWVDEADDDKRPGGVAHPADRVLRVSATIGRADTVDGGPMAPDGSNATAPTCQAPRGRVQVYVDGAPVGEPVPLVYAGDPGEDGRPVPAGDPRVTAEAVPNAEGGAVARFAFARAAADADFLVPGPGEAGRHEVSLRFLPPDDGQREAGQPANYLASAAPDGDGDVPRAEVAIEPIDPKPAVTPEPDPDKKDPDFPAPSVATGAGEPDDPGADSDAPCDKTYRGQIATTWGEPSDANPHPGRVILKVETPSTAPIEVTDAEGNVFEAEFAKDENGKPLRGPDGSYTLVLDPTAVGAGKLVFKQKPNGAYTGSTWVYDVTVRPDASVAPEPELAKSVRNLTHPEGPTQPGDRLAYTITASNGKKGSLWTDVVATDALPACLVLDEGSVRLDNPSAGISGEKLEKAAAVAAGDVGRFSLSAPGTDGRPVLAVPVGDVGGGSAATVAFECTVRGGLDFSDAGAIDLGNVAEAAGTRPDPDDPDNPMPDPSDPGRPLPVGPDPTGPVAPPGPGTVVPADPRVKIAKSVENASAPGAKVTHVGDVLRYAVELRNDGPADSCLVGAVVSDPLPAGMEPVPRSIEMELPDGTKVTVDDSAYDRASRTIAVTAGDLWGGQRVVLTFEATVGEAALGAQNANIALAHGKVPSEDPDPVPTGPEPGQPAPPPSGDPEAFTPPVEPPVLVGEDPEEGDLSISKEASNETRSDGTTHVGDTVHYEIVLRNGGPSTSWMDAVVRDDVPEGLEPVAGTIRLTLPGGEEIAVADAAYDPKSRILAVAVGHLHGGQSVGVTFDALVTKDAVGADIGNVAAGYGTPPSAWDPDGEHPEPGSPFAPPEGWGAWERSHEKVTSDPAYPPGVDRLGGVIDGAADERTTIAHRLAQTGDAVAAVAGIALAAALAACALALAARRRGRV